MKPRILLPGLFALLFGLATRVDASPITLSFQNANFDDGTSLTGIFTYDPIGDLFSNWNIAVQAGTLSSFTYTPSNSVDLGDAPGYVAFFAYADLRTLELDFRTSAGVPTNGLLTSSRECEIVDLPPAPSLQCRMVSPGGTVSAPEPESISLLALGLVGLGFRLRKRFL